MRVAAEKASRLHSIFSAGNLQLADAAGHRAQLHLKRACGSGGAAAKLVVSREVCCQRWAEHVRLHLRPHVLLLWSIVEVEGGCHQDVCGSLHIRRHAVHDHRRDNWPPCRPEELVNRVLAVVVGALSLCRGPRDRWWRQRCEPPALMGLERARRRPSFAMTAIMCALGMAPGRGEWLR